MEGGASERPRRPQLHPSRTAASVFLPSPCTCGVQTLTPNSSASHQMFELTLSNSSAPRSWGQLLRQALEGAHPALSLINSPSPDNILLSCGLFALSETCQIRTSDGFRGVGSKQSNKSFSLAWRGGEGFAVSKRPRDIFEEHLLLTHCMAISFTG